MTHQFVSDIDPDDLTERLHLEAIVTALPEHAHARATSWYSEVQALPLDDGYLRYHDKGKHAEDAWYTDLGKPWSAYVRRDHDGEIHLHVAGATEQVIEDAEAWFKTELPAVEHDPNAPTVPVTFWSLSQDGPASRRRRLDVPTWDAIATNYPDTVRSQLSTLMSDGASLAGGGKLVLWHGDPGTGKTWGLRALASEWRDWCDLHYITDPETFFGASANYMLEVLLAAGDADDDDFDLDEAPTTLPRS